MSLKKFVKMTFIAHLEFLLEWRVAFFPGPSGHRSDGEKWEEKNESVSDARDRDRHIAADMWGMTRDHLLTPTAADGAPSRTS